MFRGRNKAMERRGVAPEQDRQRGAGPERPGAPWPKRRGGCAALVAIPATATSITRPWFLLPEPGANSLTLCLEVLGAVLSDWSLAVMTNHEGAAEWCRTGGAIDVIASPYTGIGSLAECSRSRGWESLMVVPPQCWMMPLEALRRLAAATNGTGVEYCAFAGRPVDLPVLIRGATLDLLAPRLAVLERETLPGLGDWRMAMDSEHFRSALRGQGLEIRCELLQSSGFSECSFKYTDNVELAARAHGLAREGGEPETVNRRWKSITWNAAGGRLDQGRWRREGAAVAAPRVLFSAVQCAFSGAEESCSLLAGHLDRERFDPMALLCYEGRFSERLREHGVPVTIAGCNFAAGEPENVQFCIEYLRENTISLVHLNHPWCPALVTACEVLNIPIVAHLRQYPNDTIVSSIRSCDRVITVSRSVADALAEYGVPPDRYSAIHNGVRCGGRPMTRVRGKAAGGAVKVLMMAAIRREKGHHWLLQAAAAVPHSECPLDIVLVGEEEDPWYRGELTALGSCGHRVRFVGFQSDPDEWHEWADIEVLCSRREPFSRALLEAMEWGNTILAFDTGGTPEMIEHGKDGLLVPYADAGALAAAIELAGRQPELRQRLGDNARSAVERRFTLARHVSSVQEVYDSVLRRRGARERRKEGLNSHAAR